jgi:hypothetical protein
LLMIFDSTPVPVCNHHNSHYYDLFC